MEKAKRQRWMVLGMVAGLGLAAVVIGLVGVQDRIADAVKSTIGETRMKKAKGTFEVKLVPQGAGAESSGVILGRMSIDKTFAGDLAGTSKGEMLSAISSVPGSAGYVAVERVSGTIGGKTGTFVLQHSSTMARGVPEQNVSVVPDSGTGELVGISGKMEIKIEGGKHFYEFEYRVEGALKQ